MEPKHRPKRAQPHRAPRSQEHTREADQYAHTKHASNKQHHTRLALIGPAVCASLLTQAGVFTILSTSPSTGLEWIQRCVFLLSLIYLASWLYFPSFDLSVMLRPIRHQFVPRITSGGAVAVALGGASVAHLIFAVHDLRWFALAGMWLVGYNALGFSHVRHVVSELSCKEREAIARDLVNAGIELHEAQLRLKELEVICMYWCCEPKSSPWVHAHLSRFAVPIIAFACGFLMSFSTGLEAMYFGYCVSALGLCYAEMRIFRLRSIRDSQLRNL